MTIIIWCRTRGQSSGCDCPVCEEDHSCYCCWDMDPCRSRKKQSPSSAETKVEMDDEKVDGKQIHSQSRQQYFSKMTYDNNVNPFVLGPAKLQARLTQVEHVG